MTILKRWRTYWYYLRDCIRVAINESGTSVAINLTRSRTGWDWEFRYKYKWHTGKEKLGIEQGCAGSLERAVADINNELWDLVKHGILTIDVTELGSLSQHIEEQAREWRL